MPADPFPPPRPASLRSRLERLAFNLFPALWSTGGRITHVSADHAEVRVKLGLHWRTRNYVGTMFGGAMFAIVDPFYMVMLVRRLGREFVVWDKASTIRFRRPGRSTLYARFVVTDAEVEAIRAEAAAGPVERVYRVELVDAEGVVHAEVEKVLYIRRKDYVRPPAEAAADSATEEPNAAAAAA